MMTDWENFNSSVLIEITRTTGIFTCSGVAINSNTVLTAAHCLEGNDIIQVKITNQMSYDKNGQFFEIISYEIHPDYNRSDSNYKFDIAKIKLKENLPQNIRYFPIIKRDINLNGRILRLGYGVRNAQNIRTLVSPEMRQIRAIEKVIELNDIYSFSGDSGGPVFVQQNGQMYLIAIHSTLSFGPDGKYSFNPLLSSHREWIVS